MNIPKRSETKTKKTITEDEARIIDVLAENKQGKVKFKVIMNIVERPEVKEAIRQNPDITIRDMQKVLLEEFVLTL